MRFFGKLFSEMGKNGASRPLKTKDKFNIYVLKQMLIERFKSVSIAQAKVDILPFVSNAKELGLWSPDFFIQI